MTNRADWGKSKALGALLAVLLGCIVAVGRPAGAGSDHIEAEQMTGAGSTVIDTTATNGTAIQFTGTREIAAGVPAGAYLVNVRIKGSNSRFRLSVEGERVMENDLGTNLNELSARVWIEGPEQVVSVTAVKKRPNNQTIQPATIDWMKILPATPGYTTRGSRILGMNGQEVRFRGVETVPVAIWDFTDQDADGLVSWGANEARVVVDVTKWLSVMCTYQPSYPTKIDDQVARLTSRGVFVMLKLNFSTKGKACNVAGAMRAMPDTLSNEFWRQIATRYKGNPLVGFDLFNEPHDITEQVWRDGGMIDGSWQAVGMQTLYNTIRFTAGAQNLLFVNGIGWGYNLLPHVTQPLNGYGYVAGTHPYCHGCGGALRTDMDAMILPAQSAGLPVMVTEFGWDKGGGTFQQNLIDWAEAHDIGWNAFTFAPWPVTEYGLLSCYQGCYTPNSSGTVIMNELLAHATGLDQPPPTTPAPTTTTTTTTPPTGGGTGGGGGSTPTTKPGALQRLLGR
jgi:hypothetical protein